MYRYEVLLPTPQNQLYTYTSNIALELGKLVEVSFGKQILNGVVWDETDPYYTPAFSLKPILYHWELPPLPTPLRTVIDWASQYYLSSRGNFLKMALTGLPDKNYASRKKYGKFINPNDSPREYPLTDEQKRAALQIQTAIKDNIFQTFLLDGVTGSGKTEVYYEALLEAIRKEQQVLILLPEITLTQQWLDRFKRRFGVIPARWHSSLKRTERLYNWDQIIKGHASVVVGARSALFLPFQKLGLIVIDEEHDSSYKQDEGVRYHARDLGILRAKLESCPIVLASATPSIESYHNVISGKYALLSLTQRFGSAGHPSAHIIDLRHKGENVQQGQYISSSLTRAIKQTVERNEQVILFLNRRGYAPLILCVECGHKLTCPMCSAYLVQHRSSKLPTLQCHHCGFSQSEHQQCPECGHHELREWGVGIERLTEEAHSKFPDARIMTISSDHITHENHLDELYTALQHHKVDIVIGTQLMAKGHDFPNVTLVGIIGADTGLTIQDVRSAESTYQLLYQVAGRCGRGDKPGHVYIQTFNPSHPVIHALKTFDRDSFLSLELHNREICHLPPFSRQASIIVTGPTEHSVKNACITLLKKVPSVENIQVFGPAPAPLLKLRRKYRYRFLLQSPKPILLQPFVETWLNSVSFPRSITLTADIDPISFI